MRDDGGIVQLFTISSNGGGPVQVTRDEWSVASSFNWSPDGRRIAYVADGSIFVVDATSGSSTRLTDRDVAAPPRPEACVFSPDGRRIAFLRSMAVRGTQHGDPEAAVHNQIFVVDAPA
jgi:Tol biopolymer transport system component